MCYNSVPPEAIEEYKRMKEAEEGVENSTETEH